MLIVQNTSNLTLFYDAFKRFFYAGIAVYCLSTLLLGFSANAQTSEEVDFEADTVTVNRDDNILTATGNVVIVRGIERLTADKVIYNQLTDKANAIGNVIYLTADGIEHRADEMVLDENFTHAIANPIISQFSDGTRFSANSADHRADIRTVFNRSRFSPCKCNYDEGESPIWDLRATSTNHDLETRTITHSNVRMHIFGLPVFYLPRLAHPDWTVNRRSGFLSPTLAYSNDKGLTSTIPYFQVLGPSNDIEYQLSNYQFRGQAVKTVYRQKWDRADLNANVITGKLETYKQSRENVGAIDAILTAKAGTGWDVTLRARRSSQDTFLRRYGYENTYALRSSIIAEKLDRNRYYLVEASDYQGLRANDTPEREPVVLPHIFYEKTRNEAIPNLTSKTEFSLLQLDNDEDNDMVRWTALQNYTYKSPLLGGVVTNQIDGLLSYYDIQHSDDADYALNQFGGGNVIGSIGWHRIIPTMISRTPASVTPKVKFTAIDGTDRTDEVPNRDASDFRLDESNMFLNNRFQGRDYILPGSRLDSGVMFSTETSMIGDISTFAGISYTSSGKNTSRQTTTDSKYSDYIASLDINTPYHINLSWAGRADSKDFEILESRTSIGFSYKGTKLNLNHTQIGKSFFTAADNDREQASLSASQKITNSLTVSAKQVWNLSNNQTKKEQSVFSALWTGGFQDCLTLSLDYERDPFADRDVKKVSQIQLYLTFKYLGTISQSDLFSKN
jgi:LPS-assembly protein